MRYERLLIVVIVTLFVINLWGFNILDYLTWSGMDDPYEFHCLFLPHIFGGILSHAHLLHIPFHPCYIVLLRNGKFKHLHFHLLFSFAEHVCQMIIVNGD